jgi:hypothetical protein
MAMFNQSLFALAYRLALYPLRNYPGPFIARLTDGYGGYHAAKKRLHLATYHNHLKYGTLTIAFSTAHVEMIKLTSVIQALWLDKAPVVSCLTHRPLCVVRACDLFSLCSVKGFRVNLHSHIP